MATSTIFAIVGMACSFGFGIVSTIYASKEQQQQIEKAVKENLNNKKN